MRCVSGCRFVLARIYIALVLAGGVLVTSAAQGQVKAFVDFTSDLHDGAGGAPNTIPDWIDELDKLAASTGITPFTPSERAGIETDIMMQLGTMYAGYDVTFSTTPPATPYDTIYFGKDSTGFGSLGVAPRDPGNIASSQTAAIAPANFTTILDEFSGTSMRSAQLSQIATALAGTGAHELGHSLGLAHHSAYSDPSITPATYSATGGVQNTHIMATGSPGFLTGLSETERETPRTFSTWSKAMFDIAGGAVGKIGGDHQSLVTSPIALDTTEEMAGVDAGDTFATAMPMALSAGETSGMLLGFVAGNPDGPPPPPIPGSFVVDADMWKLSLPSPGHLTAEVFSDERFGSFGYNTMLELFDPTGTFIIANDNVHFLDDKFNDPADPMEQLDPLLLNIPILVAGDYFLKLTPTMPGPDVGMFDGYWLLAGFEPVPEPQTAALLLILFTLSLSRLSTRAASQQRRVRS